MPRYEIDDATQVLIMRIADRLERSDTFVVQEAVARWHRELLRADASCAAEDLVLRLASTIVTDADLAALRALDPRSFAAPDESVDLLFRFLSRAWFEVYRERRPVQADADRRVLEVLLDAGLRADVPYEWAGALDWSPEVDERSLVFQSPHTALSRLADLAAFFGDEPELDRQREWLAARTSVGEDVLARLDRTTLGFRGEAALALVVGRHVREITPERWESLSALLETRDDLVLVPGADLSRWHGKPIEVVIGWPVQLALASEGVPEQVELGALREALQALPQLDLADVAGEQGAFVVAVGPLASGHLVRGSTGKATDGKREGEFHLGTTMEQVPHSYGVWGEALCHVSWEDASVASLSTERIVGLRGSVFLVARHD